MAIIAVAGGTGGLGRTLVNELLRAGHQVYLLSRSESAATVTGVKPEPQHVVLDYGDVAQIESTLRDKGIEVVVSALLLADAGASISQINLIRGAAQSGTVTKFIPSEYHLDYHVPIHGVELLFKEFQIAAEEELKRFPQLSWTLIRIGIFLDYLTMPYNPKPTTLAAVWVFMDIEHEMIVLPGDGSQTMIFTHSADLAAYIVRLIDVPGGAWPRECLIQTNRVRLADLVDMAKSITGRDFRVVYDTAEAIRGGHVSQLPSNRDVFATPVTGPISRHIEWEVMVTLLSDGYDLHGKDLAEVFPDVATVSISDFLRDGWALKQRMAS